MTASALPLVHKLSTEHDHVLKTFRLLISDLCQQYNGGHPGGAIGMAAIGVSLWKYVMSYAPLSPDFFNRDRFVLSNGHTCLFQYTFLHLSGYRAMTLEQLKSYHSDRVDALCPGHPEIEHEGIEVTTGPLGQGVANAVGLAMATKNLAATFNKPGFDVITCDGSVDLTNTEDINAKMRACNWDVIDVEDGCFDIEGIVAVLEKARASTDKPTFINCHTVIGLGSKVAGQAAAHGAAFGAADVAAQKIAYGFNAEEHFIISDRVRAFFADLPARGEALVREWNQLVDTYCDNYPELGTEFRSRMRGELPGNWKDLIPASFPETPTATRASSGLVFTPIAEKCRSFMVGTADLSPSVNMAWPRKVDFQPPGLRTACGINGEYRGRYIHYGVREHAMAAISNGMAAYAPNALIPVTSSFFMFYLYAAPAVRMGALQHLQVIHAATHDSIGMGEDGPTHQPIELASLFRAMPNILYIRPGDSEETAGAWIAAIQAKRTPSIISTSRHKVPRMKGLTRRDGVALGAYVLEEDTNADVTLIGVGAELSFALEVADRLKEQNIASRVVSFPCQRLFEEQSLEYKRATLQRHRIPAVVIEPYAPNGWERYADAGICLKRFGHSLPGKAAYEFFGYDIPVMAVKVQRYLSKLKEDGLLRHEFVDL
ncbi:uncharacterized protein CDV56_106581 [Aspergillus thermomutatus]|uniref:transketolase n=1 Tax=Aspergillus thermomutatus TaxID=41047 RepID=A0A397H9L9_ASPTH|nr:uncharacterized protein CDV56_106581 [Aspergillus thermomutatus]RHZ59805.1 hypothetical protein CDV56_106581 [Aspergillus thermomutatus]